ncbi:MAG: DUF1805 domain-containing protein [Elusimicrobiota bacterium]
MTSFERQVVIGGITFKGYELKLQTKVLITIIAPKGYLICGYLDIQAAEKFGDTAAVITGVSTVNEMLDKPVVKVTSAASKLGLTPGMTGRDALKLLV